ncbi:MAG: nucleotidyltransferase [Phycisphaeraceae bacterium]
MATTPVPDDFTEFLRFLNDRGVEYLVIGGYAVNFHGYPRTTDDIDVWIAMRAENAERVIEALNSFGFDDASKARDVLLKADQIVRMGVAPVRIEIATTIAGVDFDDCYGRRVEGELGGVTVPFISLQDLRRNKAATGRNKDLADLDELPEADA